MKTLSFSLARRDKMKVAKRFKAIDGNGDRLIDADEATIHLRFTKKRPSMIWFDQMDKNGDGFIDPQEFDSDLTDQRVVENMGTTV